ncbi:GtrA family protein [Pedobacter mendelii]|uniref:GtrA family protein n=1 Tax=Pedobacter mendelii TaxID=1908240 RepID=UPI00166B46E2|nr:GtrA family protein [Pedobacter mendelii]
MLRYLKAQASSLTASAADFLVTIALVNFFDLGYLTASIAGTFTGGGINFYINRNWVFNATTKMLKWQVFRYVLVWLGNLILVTMGVYLLTHFFYFNYLLSKILLSVLIGITYNYIMQKQFIFSIK